MRYATTEWDTFLEEKYEGGKKKVSNPNSETKDAHPEVTVSTALKDKAFESHVQKEFEEWKSKGKEKVEFHSSLNKARAEFAKTQSHLSKEETSTASSAVENMYTINQNVIGGVAVSPAIQKTMSNLDSLFLSGKANLSAAIKTSIVCTDSHPISQALKKGTLEVGSEVSNTGYTQSSPQPESINNPDSTVVNIVHPKGSPALFGQAQYASGVITPRNSKLRVTHIDTSNPRNKVVTCEYVSFDESASEAPAKAEEPKKEEPKKEEESVKEEPKKKEEPAPKKEEPKKEEPEEESEPAKKGKFQRVEDPIKFGESQNEKRESWSKEQRSSVFHYTTGEYTTINGLLRKSLSASRGHGQVMQRVRAKEYIAHMDNLFASDAAKLSEPIIVTRGVSDTHPLIELAMEGKLKVGTTMEDPAYGSTSIKHQVTDPSFFGDCPIHLEIHVPKGTRAIYLGPPPPEVDAKALAELGSKPEGEGYSRFPGEQELLLNRGYKIRVKKVSVVKGKGKIICEVVND